MFGLRYHASAASTNIGVVMEYLMEAAKKVSKKKKKNLIIFDYESKQVNPDSKSTEKEEKRNQ